jgi:hypothetical protein
MHDPSDDASFISDRDPGDETDRHDVAGASSSASPATRDERRVGLKIVARAPFPAGF